MDEVIVKEIDRICYYKKVDGNLVRHRENGPAIKYNDGNKEYFLNGKRHRLDGPAFVWGETYEYWVNGKLHRENGIALFHCAKRVIGMPEVSKYFIDGFEVEK